VALREQRTILLYGHERAVTCVKYNHEGDLLFTSSMDGKLFLWRADNGDRIGSYQDGESNSSISELDVTREW
jgi:WD40 repeat protein